MTQWGENLLCEDEDPNSYPQHLCKIGSLVLCVQKPSTGEGGQELVDTGGSSD